MSPAPEPPFPPPGRGGTSCHGCDAPLAADQRYCLECGARRGAGGPIDFAALLAPRPAAVIATRWSALPAGQAPVAATMLVALLVTGIMLGSLGSPDPGGAAQPLAIAMTPPAPPPAAAPAPTPVVPIVPAPPAPPPASTPVAPDTSADSTPSTGADTTTGGDDRTTGDEDSTDTATDDSPYPPIKHVFVIMLAQQSSPSAFTTGGGAPYLSDKLVPDGTLLTKLRTVSPSGLANSIALLSGQGPNPQTAADCPTYTDVAPGTIGKDEQEEGEGCVYSVQTSTLPSQLDRAELGWRAYIEDQGNGGPGVAATCRRPELSAPDPWREPRPGDAYATARNPFVYFHAITDAETCAENVVGLDKLDADLALAPGKAPTFSYIAPNLCRDGRTTPCAEGMPAGPAAADAFLAEIVPKIRASKAYASSLLIVTFDRPPPAPAYPAPTAATTGANVGALLLSPYVRKKRTIGGPRSTYSLLATIQRVLALDPLGNAARADAKPFGPGLFDESR